MFRLVVLIAALVGQAPVAPAVPPQPTATAGVDKAPISRAIEIGRPDALDKWFAIEYLGHFDDHKKFVYNRARLLAPTVAGEILNYGLDASGLIRTPTGVRGNDPVLRKKIEADVGERKFEAKVNPCGAIHEGPCPGPGPCPNPQPSKPPILPFPDSFEQPRRSPMDHLIPVTIAVAATTIIVGGGVLMIGGAAYLLSRKQTP